LYLKPKKYYELTRKYIVIIKGINRKKVIHYITNIFIFIILELRLTQMSVCTKETF